MEKLIRQSFAFIWKIWNFENLWDFLKFETKLKFPSISATSVIFYLPNFIPFLFPFSFFVFQFYSYFHPTAFDPPFLLFLSSLRQLASPSMNSRPFYSNMCKGCAWLPPPSRIPTSISLLFALFARFIV